jgi:rare lipoprotein A
LKHLSLRRIGDKVFIFINYSNLPVLKKLLIVFLLLPLFSLAQETKKQEAKPLHGTASFYALYFNGLKTATGEIFKHSNLTAASNNFKINSLVRVTNLLNNKSVVVRVNDRMHERMAKKGRVVDLTSAAAQLLGVGITGLLKVKVELLGKDSPAE